MRIVEDFLDEYKLKRYGSLAENLNTSKDFLKGRRRDDGIKIEELMVMSDGDFSLYQDLIKKELSRYYVTDFLDFSLLLGKFFGVYNLYCYLEIDYDVRKKLINSTKISRKNTLDFIKNNCRDIYDYLFGKFAIDKEQFVSIVVALFDVSNDYCFYNDEVVREISYILMGHYLFLEDKNLKNVFVGSEFCCQYFKRHNNKANKKRVI